jgi:hypothetical protein
MDKKYTRPKFQVGGALCLALMLLFGSTGMAQDPVSPPDEQVAGTDRTEGDDRIVSEGNTRKLQPVYREYKAVQLGMTQETVRETLGKPKDKGDVQDVFVFSDDEMTQVFYNVKGKVHAISTTYGNAEKAPTPVSVIGVDVPAADDGTVYRLVRYPESGFWVSYHRTGGENQIVTITMQKI